MKFHGHCKQLMERGREALAKKAFDVETLKKTATEKAMLGFNSYCARPKHPVDLRGTRAAKAAQKALKELGLRTEWVIEEPAPGKEKTTGTIERFTCLRVIWVDEDPMW